MAEEDETWRGVDSTPGGWVPFHDMIYTELSIGHPTARLRIMLRTLDGPIELFRAPTNGQLSVPEPGTVIARATLPGRWFEGMENAVIKRRALKALEEPL